MNKNVGNVDRAVRVVLGLILLGLVLVSPKTYWFGVLGIVPIFTAIMSWCPIYNIAGINTGKKAT